MYEFHINSSTAFSESKISIISNKLTVGSGKEAQEINSTNEAAENPAFICPSYFLKLHHDAQRLILTPY